MSRAIFDAPMIAPESSRTGEMVSEMSMAPSVLGHAHRFEMVDALPLPQSREDVVFFGLPLGRNEHSDGRPIKLVGRIAEQPLCRGVA